MRDIWLARPSWTASVFIAIVWGLVTPLCVLANYAVWRHALPPEVTHLFVIFATGAAIPAPTALWCANIMSRKGKYPVFAVIFIVLGVGTIGFTAIIFAFDFWLYFVQWHGQTFSKLWLIQFGFTFASAIYQFLVSGLRLYLPFGLIALVLASLWASNRMMR